MGGFCLIRASPATEDARVVQARRAIEQLGAPEPVALRCAGGIVLYWRKQYREETNLWRGPGDQFALAAGTFVFRSRVGVPALQSFCAAADDSEAALDEARGQFALIVHRNGRTTLLHDRLAAYQIFHDESMALFATSFLVATALLPRLRADPGSVYDYVFSGAVLGDATPVQELRLLPRLESVTFSSGTVARRVRESTPEVPQEAASESGARALCLKALRTLMQEVTSAFGDDIALALSGGYDTRLLLALLRDQEVTPRLFVYGAQASPDVAIASRIAKGEGLPLDHVDKARLGAVEPDALAETVHANFLTEDGYGWEGIFNDGGERKARERRCAQGRLQLHGGGGEVFRNFFFLPDRDLAPRELLWSFYARFDPATMSGRLEAREYLAVLEHKLDATLGRHRDRLPRALVEWLYPYFRCRAWFGRESSNNNRFSFVFQPFLDPACIQAALSVPLRSKNFGRFEASLIASLDPALARYPSAYGHHFLGPPPFRHRLGESLTLLRPPWLRRYSFMARNRLAPSRPLPPCLASAATQKVLPGDLELVRRFVRPEKMADPEQLQRVWSLEYLFRYLGSRLTID